MGRFLQMAYDAVFIVLGSACNLRCRYCIQGDMAEKPPELTVNGDVMAFVRELARSQERRLRVVFYGGEPLLYLSSMKAMVEGLRGENVMLSMISNGKGLTAELADYLNEAGVGVAVSWDGKGSAVTRGFDVVREREDYLLALRHLCLTGVLSAQNYIGDYLDGLAEFDGKYFARHGYHVGCNVDEVMDLGLAATGLTDVDTGRMRDQMERLCGEYTAFFYGDKAISPVKEGWLLSVVSRAVRLQGRSNGAMPVCGNGYRVLNVDMQGNLYRCHNGRERAGSIYDEYFNYLDGVMQYGETRESHAVCRECEVYGLCRGGCPLVPVRARERYYCELKRSVYGPVLSMVQRMLARGW